MFLVALVAVPLILIGAMTMAHAADTHWCKPEAAIPKSFSIASSLALGFVAYTAPKLLRGKWREPGGRAG